MPGFSSALARSRRAKAASRASRPVSSASVDHRAELQRAVQYFGSQQALADATNVYIARHRLNARPICQQQLSNWLHRDLRIPRDYPPVIEAVCKGHVSSRVLRGDGEPVRASRRRAGQAGGS